MKPPNLEKEPVSSCMGRPPICGFMSMMAWFFSMGTVMQTPRPRDKKVLVFLDMLGEKWNVVVSVRRTALKIARQTSAKEDDTHVHT